MNRHHHYHEEIITIRNQYPVYMHYMTRWKIEKESILLQSSNRTSILKMASFPAFIIVIFHIQPRWSLECLLKRLILKPQMEPLRITGTNTTECTNPISPESACKTLQETMSQTRVQVFFIPPPGTPEEVERKKEKEGDDSITHNPLPLPGGALHTK